MMFSTKTVYVEAFCWNPKSDPPAWLGKLALTGAAKIEGDQLVLLNAKPGPAKAAPLDWVVLWPNGDLQVFAQNEMQQRFEQCVECEVEVPSKGRRGR